MFPVVVAADSSCKVSKRRCFQGDTAVISFAQPGLVLRLDMNDGPIKLMRSVGSLVAFFQL